MYIQSSFCRFNCGNSFQKCFNNVDANEISASLISSNSYCKLDKISCRSCDFIVTDVHIFDYLSCCKTLSIRHSLGITTSETFLKSLLEKRSDSDSISNTIEVMDLAFNNLNSKCYNLIGTFIADKNTVLETLSLDGNKLSKKDFRALCKPIRRCLKEESKMTVNSENNNYVMKSTLEFKLRRLSLSSCNLGDDVMPSLIILIKTTGVISVDISNNKITSEGFDILFKEMRKNTLVKLQTLDLSYNSLGNAGVRTLFSILQAGHLPNLRHLKLRNVDLGPIGMESLLLAFDSKETDDDEEEEEDAMSRNEVHLTTLDLSGNQIFLLKKKKKTGSSALVSVMKKLSVEETFQSLAKISGSSFLLDSKSKNGKIMMENSKSKYSGVSSKGKRKGKNTKGMSKSKSSPSSLPLSSSDTSLVEPQIRQKNRVINLLSKFVRNNPMQLQWLQLCDTGFDTDVFNKLSTKITQKNSSKKKKGVYGEEKEEKEESSHVSITIVAKLNKELSKKKRGDLSHDIRLIC